LTFRHPSSQTDTVASDEVAKQLRSTDPAVGLRAVGALRRLAEQVEAAQVIAAREQGWSWEQIGDALGVSRQSVHAKYGRGA
jgi:DNA-directed RNA polymerase specialized sigma24 family protein